MNAQEGQHLVVMCTTPTREVADALARLLVEARAAACVNIVGEVHSVYRWDGDISIGNECQLIIKTTREKFPEIETLIRTNHPHKIPEIIALPVVSGSSAYLQWLRESTS
ncbi:MAG: divalent-cation tolerance protein CutA [Sandaracinaceae bacterium]|nr:divalent-cation tolerance protein CutA [Sandaracinaceae bacterium]